MGKNIINDKEVKKALNIYGKDVVAELAKQLLKLDKKASGKLIKSLDYKIRPVVKKMVVIIESEDYLHYVDKGRRPGKMPPINAISKWASIKGISQKAVFPIAKKIGRLGIKPTHVLDKTLKALNKQKHFSILEESMNDWIDDTLDNIAMSLSEKGNFVVDYRP